MHLTFSIARATTKSQSLLQESRGCHEGIQGTLDDRGKSQRLPGPISYGQAQFRALQIISNLFPRLDRLWSTVLQVRGGGLRVYPSGTMKGCQTASGGRHEPSIFSHCEGGHMLQSTFGWLARHTVEGG